MIYAFFAVLYGILMSVQTAFCADLTSAYGNWFSVVTVHLTGFLALTPFFLTKWGHRSEKSPWYLHLGGVVGVANVFFCNYGIVNIGMTNSNVLMLLGEILFSAVLDSLGLMGARKRRITPMKWCAIAVMLFGCSAIAILSGSTGITMNVLAIIASLLRGVALVISRQLNGQLSVRSGTGYSTWMNYTTGLAASALVFTLLGFPMQTAFPAADVPFWAYLCGVFGCIGIFMCNLSSPRLSALTMSLLVFVSETAAGLVFDLFAGKLSVPTVIGCAIVSAGMVLNLLAERKQEDALKI